MEMFFTVRFNEQTDETNVIEVEAACVEDARTLFLQAFPDLNSNGRFTTAEHCITTNFDRAEGWAADENYTRACENLAAARFEEMAYGIDD